ncbi:uncharacterized protein DS421_15g509320 [Arachis hypogaea]|nr:uncharacterized protein DS421_15g509320 [Arachis hypogaea]
MLLFTNTLVVSGGSTCCSFRNLSLPQSNRVFLTQPLEKSLKSHSVWFLTLKP